VLEIWIVEQPALPAHDIREHGTKYLDLINTFARYFLFQKLIATAVWFSKIFIIKGRM